MTAETPGDRRRLLVDRIVEGRRDHEPIRFDADGIVLEYDDSRLRIELTSAERERLEALLETYRVFKVAQPTTRKAEDGVVYLSAVTDAKHAADFVEALFREVYGLGDEYELRMSE